jgi:hypothetical protein
MLTKCQFLPEISLSRSSDPANSAPPVWIVVLWKRPLLGFWGCTRSSTTKSSPLAGHHPTPNHLCSLLDMIILLPRFTSCREDDRCAYIRKISDQSMSLKVPPGYMRRWGWSLTLENFLNKGLAVFRITLWWRRRAFIMIYQGGDSQISIPYLPGGHLILDICFNRSLR